MKTSFKVSVCGSGFAGNIASIYAYVDYDDSVDTIENFYDRCRSAIFQRGYNILHWTAINDLEPAKVLFLMRKEERLCKYILECCDKYRIFNEMLEHLDYFEKTGKQKSDKYTGYKFVDSDGVAHYSVSGCWKRPRLLEVMREEKTKVSGVHTTLGLLGIDVDDREGTKRILTNLGFYRVP